MATVPIVVRSSGAGLDVNVFAAFLPDGAGSEEYGISAFDDEGKRIDQLATWIEYLRGQGACGTTTRQRR